MPETLESVLESLAKEGELYEKLPEDKVRCYACGHRCLIAEGKQGICRVRFNKQGKLFVPSGYVAALQVDPIEKKPFFHALPGAKALSFGMLGCDFHCGYCFTPDVRIATSHGMLPIGDIVESKLNTAIYSHSGRRRKIQAYFSRRYEGAMIQLKAAFLPAMTVTPEHPMLARLRPDRYPEDIPRYRKADGLTRDHCLAIPKSYNFSREAVIDSGHYLEPFASFYKVKRSISEKTLKRVLTLTAAGISSRLIGEEIGKSASHVRHLRGKIQSGLWHLDRLCDRKAEVLIEGDYVRLSKEHAPGIPRSIPLDTDFAELFGWYCAEGSVSKSRGRVHASSLNFSFGKHETSQARRVRRLIKKIFGVKAYCVERETTRAVVTGKTSLALLFKGLCGGRGSGKRVPEAMFEAKREVVLAFLKAYAAGDGCRAKDGQIRISTISEELAWGIAWLVQKSGYLPQCYKYPALTKRKLLGREIKQSPWVYLVRWYEIPKKQRHVWEDADFRYVLIEDLRSTYYKGYVYNIETEEEHTYLANFTAVHNCQNWVTSQALRDPVAGVSPERTTPAQLVAMAKDYGAEVVTSTYNEPLITSEWAVEVFKEAKKAGLRTSYVSNGNGTSEVIDYIRPWVDFYKVDLKGFDDKDYRSLGGELSKVLETIRRLHEKGLWVEIVTLLIPGFNDSDQELSQIADFLVSVSPDIPWHVTAFHKDYKMTDPENTGAKTLLRAAAIGKKAGLHFVYAGNIPGQVGGLENTYCPGCEELLIERYGFRVTQNRLSQGICPKCKITIPGVWN